MQRLAHGVVAACALALLPPGTARADSPAAPAAVAPVSAEAAAPAAAVTAPEPPAAPNVFGSAFAVRPLDTLVVTGGYGEGRSNHFHAGWDFSTGGRVGRAVRAPLAGSVERVRASGAGYGRALYLRADDGRLLVFGHLDAYAPALAAHVDSAQRAAGRYEQDLWPAPGRFRFAAGETIAWSGESGAGPPHLHVEVRHADFAMHPLRAGFVPAPIGTPRLPALTLEPLDANSRVSGGVSPRTLALRATPDTLEAEGRLRAVVTVASGVPGASDAPAWSTALEWNGETVEARLDSISWAGEMSEQDFLVDRGRIGWRGGLVLWAPAGFRPRFLRTSAPADREAGVIEVKRGDPPRALRVVAREPGGAAVARAVVLRPPAGTGPAPVRARPAGAPPAKAKAAAPAWIWSVLPGPLVRARVTGVPPGLDSVRVEAADGAAPAAPAHWDGAAWVAVLPPPAPGGALRIRGRRADGTTWSHAPGEAAWPSGRGDVAPAAGVTLALGAGELFEPGVVFTRALPGAGAPAQGLAAAGPRVRVRPEATPLRRPVRVTLALAAGDDGARVALYRRRGGAWEWMGARLDATARTIAAESGLLGEFALMRDTRAPLVGPARAPKRAAAGPYSRWQLVAHVAESGSGLDAAASAFYVDGERVPSEWDPETKQLRWRPLAPPAPGVHRWEVRVADRAGNPGSRRGTFVLDSGRP